MIDRLMQPVEKLVGCESTSLLRTSTSGNIGEELLHAQYIAPSQHERNRLQVVADQSNAPVEHDTINESNEGNFPAR